MKIKPEWDVSTQASQIHFQHFDCFAAFSYFIN